MTKGQKVRIRPEFKSWYRGIGGPGRVVRDTSLGIAVKVSFPKEQGERLEEWVEIQHLEKRT